MSREELEKKAESLGIKFDGRWSDETLAKKIEEAELSTDEEAQKVKVTEAVSEETVEIKVYTNAHNGKLQLSDTTVIDAGKSIELTEKQLALKDVQRLIEIRMLRAK